MSSDLRLHNRLFSMLSLVQLLARGSLAFKNSLAVLVHLQLHNDDLRRMDANVAGGSVNLLTLNSLNVDHVLLPVHLNDLSNLLAFVVTTNYLHFIIFADWDATDVVLEAQFFRERRAHNLSTDMRWRAEVSLPVLAAGRTYEFVELHFLSAIPFLDNIVAV